MATETSAWSLQKLIDEHEVSRMQGVVLNYVSFHPGCFDREIAQALGLKINQVTSRRNELCSMGLVEQNGMKYDEATRRKVRVYYPAAKQMEISAYVKGEYEATHKHPKAGKGEING